MVKQTLAILAMATVGLLALGFVFAPILLSR